MRLRRRARSSRPCAVTSMTACSAPCRTALCSCSARCRAAPCAAALSARSIWRRMITRRTPSRRSARRRARSPRAFRRVCASVRRRRWRCRTSWCFTAIRRIRSAGKRRRRPAKRCMILTSCPAAVTFVVCALRARRRMRLPRACARPASARTARTPCALPSRTATTVWRQPVCAGWRRSKRSRPSRRRPIPRATRSLSL